MNKNKNERFAYSFRLERAALFFFLTGGSLFTVMSCAWIMWFLGLA